MMGFNSALDTPAKADTVVVLTSGTTWTPPAGVTLLKKVECWGPGGAGWLAGGGGGAFAGIVNLACTPGTAISMLISAGGDLTTFAGSPANDAKGFTWFKSTTTVKADYGRGGQDGTTTATSTGIGGKASNSVGTTVYDGGTAPFGSYRGISGTVNAASGGGGAAGPDGAGAAGVSNYIEPSGGPTPGTGGQGDNGLGGVGGTSNTSSGPTPASDGGPGAANQNGGGGGGAPSWNDGNASAQGGNAGAGGFPGGGGGGAYLTAANGAGGQIRITY